jgi:hypothetical protein
MAGHKGARTKLNSNYDYKGLAVTASARQINYAPNEAWRPLYRINGKDQSLAWTPRDRTVVFATEKTAIAEAGKRARWLIDNSPDTLSEPK